MRIGITSEYKEGRSGLPAPENEGIPACRSATSSLCHTQHGTPTHPKWRPAAARRLQRALLGRSGTAQRQNGGGRGGSLLEARRPCAAPGCWAAAGEGTGGGPGCGGARDRRPEERGEGYWEDVGRLQEGVGEVGAGGARGAWEGLGGGGDDDGMQCRKGRSFRGVRRRGVWGTWAV